MSDSEHEKEQADEGAAPVVVQPVPPQQAASFYPVCRLTDTNYAAWSHKMRMLLKRESLWTFIERTPTPLTGENLRMDERAQAHIVLSLEDELLVHVRGLDTAKQCWDALKEIYARQSVASKISLSRRLYRTRLKPGGCIREHLRVMKGTFKDLDDVGVHIPELQKALTVLSSLDSSWDTFALTLEAIPETTLTLSYLTGRLLEEDAKRTEFASDRRRSSFHPSTSREAAAEFANDRRRGGSHPSAPRGAATREENTQVYSARRCYRCGSTSHLQRSCTSRAPEKRKNGAGRGTVAVVRVQEPEKGQWLIDSGASNHICCDAGLFPELQPANRAHVSLANGDIAVVRGAGNMFVPGLRTEVHNVLCVPSLKQNLLSVSCLIQEGFMVSFKNRMCYIDKEGSSIKIPMKENLFVLEGIPKAEAMHTHCTNRATHKSCAHLWHKRLCHINYRYIQKTAERARGISLKECNQYVDCDACKQAKTNKAPVQQKSTRRSQRPFELVHADLIGPLRATAGGARYVLLITDDYSRFSYCYLLKEKKETCQTFKGWVNMVERRFPHKVSQLQTDRGGEFLANVLQNWLAKKGIMHRKTNPYSPSENGVAERKNGILQIMQDTLLAQSGLGQSFWGEALLAATHVSNRTYSIAVDDIPYCLLYGKAPDLSYLRCFGAKAWVHIPRQNRRKGSQKARLMTCVGYAPLTKGYRFLTPDKRGIVISRSANFCEQELWPGHADEAYHPIVTEFPTLQGQHTPSIDADSRGKEHESVTHQTPVRTPETEAMKQEVVTPREQSPPVQRRILPERSTRGVPPQRFTIGEAVAYNVQLEPQKYEDILELPSSERRKWFSAMHQEMQAMEKLGVFTPCTAPPGTRVIGCRWVYRIKPAQEGSDPIYRARLVAKGFSQQQHIDFEEIFSPTVAARTIRFVLALAAQQNWHVHHYDVQTAYLNATLQETLYMDQAPGFELPGPEQVYKLHRSIYGLRQSARQWCQHLKTVLESIGFRPTTADACVYTKGTGTNQLLILAYVDDLLILGADIQQIKHTAQSLEQSFTLRDLGPVKQYLGIEIQTIPNKGFAIHQTQKIGQLLEKWRMLDCKPAKTPMVVGQQVNQEGDVQLCNVEHYKSLLGSLQHIALWTRPDICNAVNILSRYTNNPNHKSWTELKRVLRYLKGTQDMRLNIKPIGPLKLECYVDSSWAEAEDRKSTSGNAIMLANTLVDWTAKKQTYLALSTCEAEFASLSELCTSLIWIKQLLSDLGVPQEQAIKVHEDNMACLQLATSERVKTRSKHVDIRYQNVRQAAQEGLIKIEYCPSEDNRADILTKPLTMTKFNKGLQMLGMK